MATTTTRTIDTQSQPSTPVRTADPLADQVAECIRRHLAGDRDAMGDLARKVTPWLHHVVRGYRLPRDMADDVVQCTLQVALLHVHQLRNPTAGLAWLSVVARREALRVIQAERRYVPVDELESLLPACPPASGPEEIVLAGLSDDMVRRTVSKLPSRHRVLLERMMHSDRPNYATISAELQMPLGSIGPTRRRGLERMRSLLAADPEWDTEASAC
jgi:DNA-directed RNA polymerase specialized sigma24 family protein